MLDVNVINLASQPDRWVRAQKRFTQKGFNPIRFDGVNPRNVDLSKVILTHTADRGKVGCAMSHRTLIKDFLNSDADYIIIAEDDTVPVKDSAVLEKFINSGIPRDADIINLACMFGCSPKIENVGDVIGASLYGGTGNPVAGYPNLYRSANMLGTYMYLCTRKGAEFITQKMGSLYGTHVDLSIGFLPGITIYNFNPRIAIAGVTSMCGDSSNVEAKYKQSPLCKLDDFRLNKSITLGYVMTVKGGGTNTFEVSIIILTAILSYILTRNLSFAVSIVMTMLVLSILRNRFNGRVSLLPESKQ